MATQERHVEKLCMQEWKRKVMAARTAGDERRIDRSNGGATTEFRNGIRKAEREA